VAGHSSILADKLGFGLPITSMALQAMVSEPVKPVLDVVLDGGFYVSQSDRGELVMGGGTDVYNSYAQRGGFQRVEDNMAALVDLFPSFGRLRFMRQWAGIVDLTPDSSPILGPSPIGNVFLNCGWGSYGFKAIPAGGVCLARPGWTTRRRCCEAPGLPTLRHARRDRVHLGRAGSHRAARSVDLQRRAMARLPVHARQSARHSPRALVPYLWLRPVVPRRAGHVDASRRARVPDRRRSGPCDSIRAARSTVPAR
jgi:hypothetical protein